MVKIRSMSCENDDRVWNGNGISRECQYLEEAISAQNYGPIIVA